MSLLTLSLASRSPGGLGALQLGIYEFCPPRSPYEFFQYAGTAALAFQSYIGTGLEFSMCPDSPIIGW